MRDGISKYEVIVIGGGLSGCNAACYSAATGCRTLLLSINMDSTAIMQFKNIISPDEIKDLLEYTGGYKSPIKKIIEKHKLLEVNGKELSLAGIKKSLIIDRKRFALEVKEMIERQENLETRQGLAAEITEIRDGYKVLTSDELEIFTRSIVVCTGTFLDAKIYWGENKLSAGRPGEIHSARLFRNLKKMGISFKKKKELAAPRILRSTVNKRSENIKVIINGGQEMYYIHDNTGVTETPDDVFFLLLPEGKESEEMYVHGFETDISEQQQEYRLSKINGLEDVYMTRPGYRIEFASLSTKILKKDLETPAAKGLFFAGRVTGASSYEVSLTQGLLAGINAGRNAKGREIIEPGENAGLL